MRILRSIVLFVLVLGALGFGFFLISREILLLLATSKISNSLSRLKQLEEREQYFADCSSRGAVRVEGEDFVTYQLRFENNKDFQLEAVCSGFSLSPIHIDQDSLPLFAEKVPGEAGILWGDYTSGIKLNVFGRTAAVFVEDRMINSKHVNRDYDVKDIVAQPVSSCNNYGYFCCQDDFEKGMGEQLLTVTDCPKSCFAMCEARPVVLSLTSQPFADQNTKKLHLKSGEIATFFYVVSDTQNDVYFNDKDQDSLSIIASLLSKINGLFDKNLVDDNRTTTQVSIDFGDGMVESLTDLQGSVSHSYTCNNFQGCNYSLKLTAINSRGVESSQSILSNLDVVVNQ